MRSSPYLRVDPVVQAAILRRIRETPREEWLRRLKAFDKRVTEHTVRFVIRKKSRRRGTQRALLRKHRKVTAHKRYTSRSRR